MKLPKWLEKLFEFFGWKGEEDEPDNELQDFPIDDEELLWKPGGHDTGKLVVLFPSDMPNVDIKDKWKFKEGTKFIYDADVCRDAGGVSVVRDLGVRKTHISEPEDKVTDKLNPNGNRVHARSDWTGKDFGRNIYVVAYWENFDGSESGVWSRLIPDGGGRWEGRDEPLRRVS